jgi:hypothetical protein
MFLKVVVAAILAAIAVSASAWLYRRPVPTYVETVGGEWRVTFSSGDQVNVPWDSDMDTPNKVLGSRVLQARAWPIDKRVMRETGLLGAAVFLVVLAAGEAIPRLRR